MSEVITPLEAKRLREAFKNTKDGPDTLEAATRCDYVWIFGQGIGRNNTQTLSLEKDGVPIAWIPITNGMLKKLRGEFAHWRQIGSGSCRSV